MSGSAVHKVFSEKLKAANKDHKTDEFKLTLKRHSDTRWTSQFESCRAARSSMEFIVETLEQFSDIDERNADRRNVADQLLSGITTTFLIHLVMFEEILRVTSTLARCLQGKNFDLASALHQIENVVIQFDTARNDVASTTSLCQTIWVTAQSIINELDLPKPAARFFRKTRYQTVAAYEDPNTENEYLRVLFYPVIDRILIELRFRFSHRNIDIYRGILALSTLDPTFLDHDAILCLGKHFAEPTGPIKLRYLKNDIAAVSRIFESRKATGKYQDPKSMVELLSNLNDLKEAISEFYVLLRIAVTFPITTASCERSFSVLKRIKNWLRTSCTNDRLGDLGVWAICSQRAESMPMDDIISEFKATGPGGERKIAL